MNQNLNIDEMVEKKVKEILEKEVEAEVAKALKKNGPENRAAFVASKGTLDMAYPPLILATTAAALDMEAAIFFTFYGLDILHKDKQKKLKVPSLANPAMPVPMPNILGALPGMTSMATMMMNSWMKKANVMPIGDLLETCVENDVKLIGCQMTMDVMGVKRSDLMDGIEVGGAAMFMEYASRSSVTLFV